MTPVEQTRTSVSSQPMPLAVSAVIHFASSRPCCPVQALELPELMITPRTDPLGTRSRDTCTGAPTTRFCVNTPAATHGTSETNSERSSFAGSVFSPQAKPAARKPSGRE